ncbi:MAG: HAMP domain-containing histidine kinase [Bacteriovoracaceae bacterium]|nr:HAMP domain-containing histidine kinase [Bacteriovoracaceae bacterium]
MEYQQDFSSSPELKHPFFEILCIGFMAFAWAIFILSTSNYKHVHWYEWLYYSRISMSLLGILLVALITVKKLYNHNIASTYLLLSVGIQASHGYFEGSQSVDFYNFIGIVFLLSCISYNGTLTFWLKRFLPFYLIFFITPLFFKSEEFFLSTGKFIDSFSPMVAGLIIGIAILKITSSRYQFILKYLQSKNEVIKLAYQVAHDIRSPVSALRIALEDIRCDKDETELIKFSLNRIEEISNNLLDKYKEPNPKRTNTFIDEIKYLINEKKLIYNESVKFDLAHHPNFETLKFFKPSSDLMRVLSNILNNSIEAIDVSGLIKIHFNLEGSDFILSISDNGKGIPEDVLQNFREKTFSFNKASGHGLGLNHAKDFITKIGGSLKIDSITGVGTRIKLTFPGHAFE